MNFASNKQCRECREQRHKTLAEPGDWECPSCVSLPLCLLFSNLLSSYPKPDHFVPVAHFNFADATS